MVDFNNLAIADCIKHPKYGVVSHQPGIHDSICDNIRVRDINGTLLLVKASDCEETTLEETQEYWKNIKW